MHMSGADQEWRPDRAEDNLVRMNDVTQILAQIEQGNAEASEQLLPLVYDELRKLAAARLASEKPGQTLQATALVHEAYLRLVGPNGEQRWDSRGHFFAAAAEAMRRILINRARDRQRLEAVASHRAADRPDRFEPRQRKRYPRKAEPMTKPRCELKRLMRQGVTKI
jgi:RNA polymerase sigma factor (TIGR02999 family)